MMMAGLCAWEERLSVLGSKCIYLFFQRYFSFCCGFLVTPYLIIYLGMVLKHLTSDDGRRLCLGGRGEARWEVSVFIFFRVPDLIIYLWMVLKHLTSDGQRRTALGSECILLVVF